MFEINITPEPIDALEEEIINLFEDDAVEEHDRDDLRPLLRKAITDPTLIQDVRNAMVFTIIYVANEMSGWRGFLNEINLDAFFGNRFMRDLISMAYLAALDPLTANCDFVSQFLPFLAEQYIAIYEQP